MGEHFFWITSRAAGVTALICASAAVALGLLMGGRFAGARRGDVKTLHEALSLATLTALAVHALALLGDNFIGFGLADIALPFVSGYRRVWTTTGIVAGWMLLILGLSYYARGRIGPARWKRLHRYTALAWLLGALHGLMEGTDAGAAWFLVTIAAVMLPTVALLAVRMSGSATPVEQR